MRGNIPPAALERAEARATNFSDNGQLGLNQCKIFFQYNTKSIFAQVGPAIDDFPDEDQNDFTFPDAGYNHITKICIGRHKTTTR